MPRSHLRSGRMLLLSVACVLLAACSAWRPWQAVEKPWTAETFKRAEAVRLRLADGSTVELVEPTFAEEGAVTSLAGRVAGASSSSPRRAVELSQVVGLEVRKLDGDRMVGNVLAGVALVGAILLVFLLVGFATGAVPIVA